MNGKKRVEAALAGQVADRAPFGWWGHTHSEEWDPARLADATVKRARDYKLDFVKLQPRATCFAEAFGNRYRPSVDPLKPPELEYALVGQAGNWESVGRADSGAPPLAEQIEALRLTAAALGPEIPVIQTVFSPLTVAGYLAGPERDKLAVKRAVQEGGRAAQDALQEIAATLRDFIRACDDAGGAGIFYAVSGYGSAEVMTEAEYQELAIASDMAAVESLPEGSWFNVLHLCGSLLHQSLPLELPFQAVSWAIEETGNPGLAGGAAAFKRAVMGGLDRRVIASGSPQEVRSQVRAALKATGGRGFLLAPGCSVPPLAPESNLTEITEAVQGA